MADEHQPDKTINIQSSVSVGTATDQTRVIGTKVSVGTAKEVHLHGEQAAPPSLRSLVIKAGGGLLIAFLVNVATSRLPESWQSYTWLALPLVLIVTAWAVWDEYRQSRSGESNVALGSSLNERNRRAMLQKVKTIWIEGLLEQSLAKELRIALDLTEHPDAVELPLNALVQELRHPPRELPAGTPIIQIFEQMGGVLLILGAPGAGKTTLLLELARGLIERAEQDEGHPIPVVFNLSSWATKRGPLKEWLVEELNTKYDVPRNLAQRWVNTDVVLPLLDGLDEVAAEKRSDCVEAINSYRQAHGMLSLAICSRVEEYTTLPDKLRLQSAILVQPLTKQQVDTYLERAGEKLAGVRAALKDDTQLSEMLDTPLMLSIVALTYKDKPLAEFEGREMSDEWRRNVFDAYIAAMFQRRGKGMRYTSPQTMRWLSWLAQRMSQHHQTTFLIEDIQPDWLQSKGQWWLYIVVLLLIGVPIIILFIVSISIFQPRHFLMTLLGLIFFLLRSDIRTVEVVKYSPKK